jgi:4,5-DOPA dioxygenase extradiol
MSLPALFLSHGAPTLALQNCPVSQAWAELACVIGRPESILMVSAHWDTPAPAVTLAAKLETIHDFHGFPRELYKVRYVPPGSPALAARTSTLLAGAGYAVQGDPTRGIDHGGWVPLRWMYPDADIPVVQLSVQSSLGARHHLDLGRALAPLRDEGVLVIGSGGIVHNLRELDWNGRGITMPWAQAFNDWIVQRVEAQAADDLAECIALAPEARHSHPSEEHLVPFHVALGAGGFPGRRIDLGFDLGSLGMDAYLFGAS